MHISAKLFDLFERAPAAIAVFAGPEHRVEFVNDAYCQLSGRRRDLLLQRRLADAFPELAGSAAFAVLDQVFTRGETVRHAEYQVTWERSPGQFETAYFDWTCQPVRGDGDRITGTAQFFYDVTERVRARRDLDAARSAAESARAAAEAAKAEAETASRAKDEFLAMLGHELRNPLSPILTALELMTLRGSGSREQAIIERQVGHLVRLVDDLLDVSRITRGKIELRRRPLELSAAVVRGVEIASPLLEVRQQRLDLQVDPEGLMVCGDPDRLGQVVSNLLTNAAKYSPPGSRISVQARRRDGQVELAVRDQGVGLAPDSLEKIFDTFVQHQQSSDRSAGGLGLGLAIVRSLVRLHGGRVVAESEGLGKGSVFTVTLPLANGAEAEAVTRSPAGPPTAPGQGSAEEGRILVVDDNPDAAETLADTLRELGYEVQVANDGPRAIELARQFRPGVALLDIGLPVMDGYELAERLQGLRELAHGIRLIAVTGYGQEGDRRRSRAAGFHAHLVKPVNLDTLQAELQGN